MEETKKVNIFKKWWFYLIIVVLITITTLFIFISLNKPKFQIGNFNMETEKNEYKYTDTSISYTGKGEVVCSDLKNPYIVIVKVEKISGGKEDDEKEQIQQVIVNQGKGTIITYDYGSEKEITRPKYSFEIKGYIKLNKLDIMFKS